MSVRWERELRAAWEELVKHPAQRRQFRTKRLSGSDITSAYAGLRAADDGPCLLFDGSISPEMLFEVGGMRLAAYQGEMGPLVALTLEDRGQSDLFLKVCSDALESASTGGNDGYFSRLLARLDAWRGFLREHRTGLTKNEAVGLIGELLLLEKLLSRNRDLLLSWVAPSRGLHDFVWQGHALEVKTSIGPASRLGISTLDQLDPTGLSRLDLIHTRLNEVAVGRCLKTIVQELTTLLADESSRRMLLNGLLKRGLMPDDNTALEYPLIEERETTAYRVSDEFPKLIRSAVPTEVLEASYALGLHSLGKYSIELEPVLQSFAGEIE